MGKLIIDLGCGVCAVYVLCEPAKITNSEFSDWLDDTVLTRFYYPQTHIKIIEFHLSF